MLETSTPAWHNQGNNGRMDRRRESWAVRPGTSFYTKMEVLSGGKLDLEDVEIRGTYLGTGGLHNRDETAGFPQWWN